MKSAPMKIPLLANVAPSKGGVIVELRLREHRVACERSGREGGLAGELRAEPAKFARPSK